MTKQVSRNTKPAAAPLYVAAAKGPQLRVNTRHDNIACWQAVQAVLAANPKGVTMAQVVAAMPATNKAFAGYCVRRGWLVPA